jgi:hypothetical protein
MFKLSPTQVRTRKRAMDGLCTKCTTARISDKSTCRCDNCLKIDRERTRLRNSSLFGRWVLAIHHATTNVLRGRSSCSVHLTWSHKDAVAAMGEGIKFYAKEGFVADHKIPIACALNLNNTIDYEFGHYVTDLDNIQIITKSANSAKVHNVEREIKQTATILRRSNVVGRALYMRLLSEFGHRLSYTDL